jgi:SAM-dependent methyltransferase
MLHEESTSNFDPLFGTQQRAILELWDSIQRLQTDFAFAQELSAYYLCPQWHSSSTVLDIGTGNGYYLGKLAARFPDKGYHGVDVSGELIAIAEKEVIDTSVSFSNRSIFDVSEPYDFVLMRLLVQHLNDIPAVLDHVAAITTHGGSALIIDAHDAFRFFYPAFPEFTEFFSIYAEHQRKAGREREVVKLVEQAIRTSSSWRWGSSLQLLIPSTIPGNLELFTHTYTLFADLVSQTDEIQYDFSALKEAWQDWSQIPNAYAQVGLNLITIHRV